MLSLILIGYVKLFNIHDLWMSCSIIFVSYRILITCIILGSNTVDPCRVMLQKQIQTELNWERQRQKETEIERHRDIDRLIEWKRSLSFSLSLCMLNPISWQLPWGVIMIAKHSAHWQTEDVRSYLCQFILLRHMCNLRLSRFFSLSFLCDSFSLFNCFLFLFFLPLDIGCRNGACTAVPLELSTT